jgi:hypothetical protein
MPDSQYPVWAARLKQVPQAGLERSLIVITCQRGKALPALSWTDPCGHA